MMRNILLGMEWVPGKKLRRTFLLVCGGAHTLYDNQGVFSAARRFLTRSLLLVVLERVRVGWGEGGEVSFSVRRHRHARWFGACF